jgi:uncharacterized protein
VKQRPQLFGMLAGLFLAAGLICSSMLATATWLKVRNSQFISVKGSTRKNVTSDLIVWQGAFMVQAPELLDAEHKIQTDRDKVESFLTDAGVNGGTFAPIAIEEVQASVSSDANGVHVDRQKTIGYKLTQNVRVESTDIGRLAKLDPTPLIASGVLFTSAPPVFLYTNAAEEKIEMLADATRDARARAEQIAEQGGRKIAGLHDAEMGVFQITPLHESDTSSEGESDTSSQDKTITAVVTATFVMK